MSSIAYFGHSSFRVALGDTVIYIDPYFAATAERVVGSAGSAASIKAADLVLITHEHYDHCEKSTVEEIVGRTHASVVAPAPALAQLSVPEKLKVQVEEGNEFSLKGVEIRVVKAVHPQSQYPVGYVISGAGKSVYHAGDTYEFFGMADISADYALIPVGGTYTMDVIGALKAAKELQVRKIIPMHYGTWQRIRQDVHEFEQRVNATGKKSVTVMQPGDEMDI